MNLFKRFSATFTGSVEQAVSHLENHEAVVEVVLRDTRRSAAQAKVRLARVKRDGAELERRLGELEEARDTWLERARGTAAIDEQKALECIARSNRCKQEIGVIEAALAEHRSKERELGQAVQQIDERIREIQTSRNLLRSRQSTAEAYRSIRAQDGYAADDILERWEAQIVEAEYLGPLTGDDPLEEEFAEREAQADLRAQLDELLREDEGDEETRT